MKIRLDFVTNSSSSSFIVALDKKPETAEDLKVLLFGDTSIVMCYDYHCPADKVAKTVFSDLLHQEPLSTRKVYKEARSGYIYNPAEGSMVYFSKGFDWDEYIKKCRVYATKTARKFLTRNKGKEVYLFHYADEDGSYGTLLEHGKIFKKLDHIRVSHH